MSAFSPQFLDALAWTLIHFLWQGLVIGLVTAGVLRVLRNAKPQARYTAALIAFSTCLIVPVATFAYLWHQYATQISIAINGDGSLPGAFYLASESTYPEWFLKILPDLPTVLVALWLAGVVVGGLKLLAGFLGVQWVRRNGMEDVPLRLQQLFDELCADFELSGRVALRVSHRILSPMAVGWLRPLVLVPASAWLGLRQDELRLILAHELAHIRRLDYLVNLLQQMTVTILFYHPVVHWLSRVLSEEREICCDEMVVGSSESKRLAYAKALLHLQEQHSHMMTLVMSARGGAFLRRVYRLLTTQQRQETPRAAVNGVVGLSIVGLVNLVFVLHTNEAVANLPISVVMPELDDSTVSIERINPLDNVLKDVRVAWESATERRLEATLRRPAAAATTAAAAVIPDQPAVTDLPPRAAVEAEPLHERVAANEVVNLQRINALSVSSAEAARRLARRAMVSDHQPPQIAEPALNRMLTSNREPTRSEQLAAFNLDKITVHEPALASSLDVKPRLLRKVQPHYPLSARFHGADGDVRLIYHLNPDGSISNIEHDPSSSGHPALVKAAVRALEEWEYAPFHYDRPLVMAQTFRFIRLEQPEEEESCFSHLKDSCGWNKRAMDRIKINDGKPPDTATGQPWADEFMATQRT